MKKAIITGITGQDGSYLAELLLDKGYEVHGLIRRSSTFNTSRIMHIFQDPHIEGARLKLHYADLTDGSVVSKLVQKIKPDEIYNLGAQSHVLVSFDMPAHSMETNVLGTLNILEAIRESGLPIKFYQASSSEMFGKVREIPQTENTPFYPRSPYGVSKLASHWLTINYRESYNIFACSGILFNHESKRRGETFVTRKITRAAAKIKEGEQDCLYLGNLDAVRDWGHSKDYVEAMWLMLQQEKPDDYVVATGESHSVREFLELAFKEAGIEIESNGKKGLEEEYHVKGTDKVVVKIDPRYYRPAEVDFLQGDSSKARNALGWSPRISFSSLVNEMVDNDVKKVKDELYGTKRIK